MSMKICCEKSETFHVDHSPYVGYSDDVRQQHSIDDIWKLMLLP